MYPTHGLEEQGVVPCLSGVETEGSSDAGQLFPVPKVGLQSPKGP